MISAGARVGGAGGTPAFQVLVVRAGRPRSRIGAGLPAGLQIATATTASRCDSSRQRHGTPSAPPWLTQNHLSELSQVSLETGNADRTCYRIIAEASMHWPSLKSSAI